MRPSLEQPARFDDFLGLDARGFGETRLVVFCGRSGSGKTTAIEHLLQQHPSFRDRAAKRLTGSPLDWTRPELPRSSLVVVDELTRLADLPRLARLLLRGNTVLAASHLPGWSFVPFRVFVSVAYYRTDRGTEKLARHLERLGLSFTSSALASYVRTYGSVYTEIEIVREAVPGTSFDVMLRRFRKFHQVAHRPEEPTSP